LTPDGKLLLSLRKKQFVANPSSAMLELKKMLSLLAGEANVP
jgi:hypothetical protein